MKYEKILFLDPMLTMSRTLYYSLLLATKYYNISDILNLTTIIYYTQLEVKDQNWCYVLQPFFSIASTNQKAYFYEFCKFSLQWGCLLLNSGIFIFDLLNTNCMIMSCIIWHETYPNVTFPWEESLWYPQSIKHCS